jgi:hypothetical protein
MECETLWQETLALARFDPAEIKRQLARNLLPAHGVTLLADYPLPDDVIASIEKQRQLCQRVMGDRIEFYHDKHLHLTIYSLVRSRPAPLLEEELATMWAHWLPRMKKIASQISSLVVPLKGLVVTRDGAVLVCGVATEGLCWLQEQVSRLLGVAAPRDVPLHITIGQVKRVFATEEAFGEAMIALRHLGDIPVGTLHSSQLHAVYYRSRLLDQILRSEVIPLGQSV